MGKWADRFNELPDDMRLIAAMNEAQMRVNQLLMERDRLQKRYRQSVREVNAHIKSILKWMDSEGGE